MSQNPSYSERLQKAFEPDARGVVGIVDELLVLCGEKGLLLTWEDGVCRITTHQEIPGARRWCRTRTSLATSFLALFWALFLALFRSRWGFTSTAPPVQKLDPGLPVVRVPLPKSVFRAVLARLAALCNEQKAGAVSPYGGLGQIVIGTEPSKVVSVSFTNTTAEQTVVIRSLSDVTATPAPADAVAPQGAT